MALYFIMKMLDRFFLQISYFDTVNIWMWFKELNGCFAKEEISTLEEVINKADAYRTLEYLSYFT